jgi:initiation factor 1A
MARKKRIKHDEAFVTPNTFQDVGQITKVHGIHYDVELKDGKIILGRLRGKLKNKSKYIHIGTMVLIEQWEFHTRGFRGDIVFVYNENNTEILHKCGYTFNNILTDTLDEQYESDIDIDAL